MSWVKTSMSNGQNSRRGLLVVAIAAALLAGCAHQSSPSAQIQNALSPFGTARNQTVALVANTKRSLGAADVNTLAVAYTSLQEKANAYASFMVEAVTTSSFDAGKNDQYASDLTKAIASFNKAVAPLAATRSSAIAGAWVAAFAQTLQARWNQYNGALAQLSPKTKADLIVELKRQTVWPNYEDIATETVVSSH